MTHVLRIAHLRIALHVANPEVGKREVHQLDSAAREQCLDTVQTLASHFWLQLEQI